MKEFLRKHELLTDAFGISVNVDNDNAFATVEINEIHETAIDKYEEKKGATLTLDHEEIDAFIEVLQYASNQLKKHNTII